MKFDQDLRGQTVNERLTHWKMEQLEHVPNMLGDTLLLAYMRIFCPCLDLFHLARLSRSDVRTSKLITSKKRKLVHISQSRAHHRVLFHERKVWRI